MIGEFSLQSDERCAWILRLEAEEILLLTVAFESLSVSEAHLRPEAGGSG